MHTETPMPIARRHAFGPVKVTPREMTFRFWVGDSRRCLLSFHEPSSKVLCCCISRPLGSCGHCFRDGATNHASMRMFAFLRLISCGQCPNRFPLLVEIERDMSDRLICCWRAATTWPHLSFWEDVEKTRTKTPLKGVIEGQRWVKESPKSADACVLRLQCILNL